MPLPQNTISKYSLKFRFHSAGDSVKVCTPISHPNVYGDSICLSMLRRESGNVPYEGWSGAYSATSILMQLQSFLFADNIDQDGGYTTRARTDKSSVQRNIRTMLEFQCRECSHSHSTPFPPIKASIRKLISVYPVEPELHRVIVQGTWCQTNLDSSAHRAIDGVTQSYDQYMKAQQSMFSAHSGNSSREQFEIIICSDHIPRTVCGSNLKS